MCIQVVEVYAVCGCVYYTHAVDPCPLVGAHTPSTSEVKVGYICDEHAK
jgi:hypothetical protein